MNAEVSTHVEATPLPAANPSPLSIIEQAVQKGLGAEDMKILYELHKDMQAQAALEEFNAAMAIFQSECPSIPKAQLVDYVTKSGQRIRYRHAALEDIKKVAGPVAHRNGLSWSWDTKIDGNVLHCKCTLRHRSGHSATADFPCPIDGSPAMTMAQKTKGTLTFAMRATLSQVLGLTDTETDTDGAGPAATDHAPPEVVSKDQASTIREYLSQLPDVVTDRLLSAAGVESVDDLPAHSYAATVDLLKKKVAAK